MEIFLNFAWLALSLSLVAGWVAGSYSSARHRPGECGRQVVALGILLVVLLPVVSLTDDLQSWTAPAEVENGFRRADFAPGVSVPTPIPVLWFHEVLKTLIPISRLSRQIALACDFCKPQMGELHPLENRPPPAVL